MTNRIRRILPIAAGLAAIVLPATASPPHNDHAPVKRENFTVAGHKAFVILPLGAATDKPTRWVWYAPTLGKGLPGGAENWMFDRFHRAGIAIAGIDVGESYGNLKGRAVYQNLYEELVGNRNFHHQPVLLARSRGGLMLYNWAVEHPESVGGIAGIYPVCNLASYPGLKRAAAAYEMAADELKAKLADHNPIDRLAPLANARVPILHIHGDQDGTVPLESNSAELAKRYAALGGPVEIEVIKGQGHNMWKGWFQSQKLTDFVIARSLGGPLHAPQPTKPNAVLIISDDQAWTDYGFMGHPAIQTPQLDKLGTKACSQSIPRDGDPSFAHRSRPLVMQRLKPFDNVRVLRGKIVLFPDILREIDEE